MPKFEVERTLELKLLTKEPGKDQRAVAKIRVEGDSATAWLAGRDPIELPITDLVTVAAMFGAACVELGLDEPNDELDSANHQNEPVPKTVNEQITTVSDQQGQDVAEQSIDVE